MIVYWYRIYIPTPLPNDKLGLSKGNWFHWEYFISIDWKGQFPNCLWVFPWTWVHEKFVTISKQIPLNLYLLLEKFIEGQRWNLLNLPCLNLYFNEEILINFINNSSSVWKMLFCCPERGVIVYLSTVFGCNAIERKKICQYKLK